MALPTKKQSFDYNSLLSDLLSIKHSVEIKLSQKASLILAEGYWQMGSRLCREELFKNEFTTQAKPILLQLAHGLNVEYSLLTRIIKFYKTWPKVCPVSQNTNVNWSHYKQLIVLPDDKQRNFYLKETQRNGWKKSDLANRIKNNFFAAFDTASKPSGVLKRSADKLYCYSGKVLRVVDGDTLVVDVDLGFFVKTEVRLRLKGINTEELAKGKKPASDLALKAKNWLTEKMSKCEIISFQTFKVDTYGRYVVDVFYLPGETNKEKIFKNGIFLNQELLDEGLAVKV